jgi:hypothetical protein
MLSGSSTVGSSTGIVLDITGDRLFDSWEYTDSSLGRLVEVSGFGPGSIMLSKPVGALASPLGRSPRPIEPMWRGGVSGGCACELIWPICIFSPSGGDSSPGFVRVLVRLVLYSVCEGVLPMPLLRTPRFVSSCGACDCSLSTSDTLFDFFLLDTSSEASSHSSPPVPMTSGTVRTKLTLRPFLRVVVFKPPGPGLFAAAAALFRISCAPGHRWALATSMRGRLPKAVAASFCCWARSVEGLRKALMSSSGGELGAAGLLLACVAAENSFVFSRIFVFQRLLENSLLAGSCASTMVLPADRDVGGYCDKREGYALEGRMSGEAGVPASKGRSRARRLRG